MMRLFTPSLALTLWLALAAFGQSTNNASLLHVSVLAQSPAETDTDLQIICLFQSSKQNALHGSLLETNEKLHGAIEQIWKDGLFRGDLGETVLLRPPERTLAAKRLLIIGLGDSSTFTPERMYLVGKIAFREANRLGVSHPYFAPTVRDGGVERYTTGEIAEQVVRGFHDALATEAALRHDGAGNSLAVVDFTYLAGSKFASETQRGIDRGMGRSLATAQ